MVQIAGADGTQAAHCLNTRPDLKIFLRPFVPRKGTQRHCDHLEKLKPVQCNPRERKIECYEVALFLQASFSGSITYGYWEVDARLSDDLTWTTVVCCETFELLVQCPPGKRITLGNLDLRVILESCLEDANGGAFGRKLTSTAKCWPTGHIDFRWLLRGTEAEGGPALKSTMSPAVQRSRSVKQVLSPIKRQQMAQSPETGRTNTIQQTPPPAGASTVVTAPQTTPSRIKRWRSLKHKSPPLGGICASETSPSQEQRRHSLKERASSLLQLKRQSHGSASSASTSSSWYSRSSNTETS